MVKGWPNGDAGHRRPSDVVEDRAGAAHSERSAASRTEVNARDRAQCDLRLTERIWTHDLAPGNAAPSGGSLCEGAAVDVIDVAAARAATPGCEAQAFLLSAGSSLPTQETIDAVIGHLRREAEVGGYAAAAEVVGLVDQGRADLAALVGGQADEVALATSDTAAWVKAWWGWVTGGNVRPGSAVLVDRLTYHSHYAALCTTQSIVDFRDPGDAVTSGRHDRRRCRGDRRRRRCRVHDDDRHPLWQRQPDRRGRRDRGDGRRADVPRRLPGARSAAPRREAARLPRAHRHRPQVPPGAARHRDAVGRRRARRALPPTGHRRDQRGVVARWWSGPDRRHVQVRGVRGQPCGDGRVGVGRCPGPPARHRRDRGHRPAAGRAPAHEPGRPPRGHGCRHRGSTVAPSSRSPSTVCRPPMWSLRPALRAS